MNHEAPETLEDFVPADTPEDVAVLYSWANLQGAKYRDFSASRREYRAQMRLRAAEEQRLAEARAQAEAEAAAAEAEKAAHEAEEAARFHESAARRASEAHARKQHDAEKEARERALRHAEEMSRIAAAERIEASRRAEAVAAAEAAARRETREMEEARASAERQAARYQESEMRRRELAGPQPTPVPGQISDPYSGAAQLPGRIFHQPSMPDDDMLPSRHPQTREARLLVPQPDPVDPNAPSEREYLTADSLQQDADLAAQGAQALRQAADRPNSPARHYYAEPNSLETAAAVDQMAQMARRPASRAHSRQDASTVRPEPTDLTAPAVPVVRPTPEAAPQIPGSILGVEPPRPQPASPAQRAYAAAKAEAVAKAEAAQAAARRRRGYAPDEASGFFPAYGSARAEAVAFPTVTPVLANPAEREPAPIVPAWIEQSSIALEPAAAEKPASEPSRRLVSSGNLPAAPAEALQHSRERVAARWYALKGVFDHGVQEQRAEQHARRERERQVPLVGIFSLAGGAGKTSMVATLGRALSATGEKALLTDTTSHGLLPFYFGASELRPGVMRTFSPPSGSSDAAICLLSYDVLQKSGDAASQDWFATELTEKARGMSRVLLDLSSASPWVARRLARMDATVLIPLVPDMNSVISLGAMEKFFAGMKDSSGKQVEPFYILNQFDSSLALHLDVREVMRQQLHERLLPFVIRRAPAVPEALAEGMTVMDYAPETAISEDFRNLANWLKARSAPAAGQKTARWSER